MIRARVLLVTAAIGAAVGLSFAVSSPPDAVQGSFARIIHVHVPSAWLAFLAFGVTAAGSIGWRITRRRAWDRLAGASAEIGVLFTAVALLTGMIWGQVVWGRAWDWLDARMSTTALMFFVYLGYLALRRAIPDHETRASRSSILGIIAVVQVPLVYASVYLWRTLHQVPSIRPGGSTMHPDILRAMLINLAAFTLVYAALMTARLVVARLEEALEATPSEVAARAIETPRMPDA
jgi:heme exporter protein C